jgi:nucleotide-binding universal stress UspA family protein
MRIMIAVDDSPHSARAVRFVSRMRWPAGSRVLVANVVTPALTPPRVGAEAGVPLLIDVSDEQRKHAKDVVEHAEAELQAAGLPTEKRIPTGDPRDALLRLAQDERVDLMVVGSHGRTGFAKLLLGSVSSHAVTHASCNVLVVKEEHHERA